MEWESIRRRDHCTHILPGNRTNNMLELKLLSLSCDWNICVKKREQRTHRPSVCLVPAHGMWVCTLLVTSFILFALFVQVLFEWSQKCIEITMHLNSSVFETQIFKVHPMPRRHRRKQRWLYLLCVFLVHSDPN